MSFKPELDKQYRVDDIVSQIYSTNQALWYLTGSSPDHVHVLVCEPNDDTIFNYAVERIEKCTSCVVTIYIKDEDKQSTETSDFATNIKFIKFDPEDDDEFYVYGCSKIAELYNLIITTEKITHQKDCKCNDGYYGNCNEENPDLVYESSFTPVLGTTYTFSEIAKILYKQNTLHPVKVTNCQRNLRMTLQIFSTYDKALSGITYSMSHYGCDGLVDIYDKYDERDEYVLSLLDMKCGHDECELLTDMDLSDYYCWLCVSYNYGMNEYLLNRLKIYKSTLDDKIFQLKYETKKKPAEPRFYDMNYPLNTNDFFNMLNVSRAFIEGDK